MPLLFWLDVAALSVSATVSFSLALMVVGSGLKQTRVRSFILYTVIQAAWAVCSLLLRLALWLESGSSLLLSELATLSFALMGPLLLLFTVRYVGHRRRLADPLVVLGLVLVAALSLPLFRHQLVSNPRLDANGSTVMQLSDWGLVAAALPILYVVWAVLLFWRARRRLGEPYLALSVFVLFVGFVVGGVLEIAFPLLSLTTTLSVAILGWGVIRRQLFNPLQERTAELGREVAERVRAEEALRESEARYRTLFERMPVGLYRTSLAGRVLHANHALVEMLGYPDRQTLMQVYVHDLYVDPADREREQVLLEYNGIVHGFEMRLRRYDGSVIWVRDSVRAVHDAHGELLSFEGSLEDITERVWAEEALRESEERFRKIFEEGPLGMAILSPDDRFIRANAALCRMTGYAEEELVGLTYLDITEPEDVDPGRQRARQLLSGELPFLQTEKRYVTREGQALWVNLTTSVIRDDGGKPLYRLTMVEDIGRRKRAEEERARLAAQVHEQARRVERILATVPAGVLLLDAGGRVLQANPMAEGDLAVLADAQVGDALSQLGGCPLVELLTPPPRGLWHEVQAGRRTFEVIARPVEGGPEPEHWVLVISDVTQERETRAQLQQQERLAAVGQLAAGIAHDFNNIMAAIILYAQMAARSRELSERERERMVVINEQARHATRLIEQILDFGRRAVLERRPLDLLPLVEAQIKLLKRTLPEHIEIDLAYGPDEYAVDADPTRMQQMLTNLAVNARDAMPQGGTLRIGLERIAGRTDGRTDGRSDGRPVNVRDVRDGHAGPVEHGRSPRLPATAPQDAAVSAAASAGGEWIRLTVSDTGAGIPADALPHIFEPFFTTKGPGEGSGLGLAQVHGIVGQHGGRIDVDSRLGEGTTFTIHLPALDVRPAAPSPPDVSAVTQGHGEVVLVVEDGDAVRAALVASLGQLNYQTLEAVNGEAALAVFEEEGERIALVVSDVVMPVMGGIALFHTLRQKGWQMPVILLTGHPMGKELDELRAQGLAAWLTKPPSIERLARAVADALRG